MNIKNSTGLNTKCGMNKKNVNRANPLYVGD